MSRTISTTAITPTTPMCGQDRPSCWTSHRFTASKIQLNTTASPKASSSGTTITTESDTESTCTSTTINTANIVSHWSYDRDLLQGDLCKLQQNRLTTLGLTRPTDSALAALLGSHLVDHLAVYTKTTPRGSSRLTRLRLNPSHWSDAAACGDVIQFVQSSASLQRVELFGTCTTTTAQKQDSRDDYSRPLPHEDDDHSSSLVTARLLDALSRNPNIQHLTLSYDMLLCGRVLEAVVRVLQTTSTLKSFQLDGYHSTQTQSAASPAAATLRQAIILTTSNVPTIWSTACSSGTTDSTLNASPNDNSNNNDHDSVTELLLLVQALLTNTSVTTLQFVRLAPKQLNTILESILWQIDESIHNDVQFLRPKWNIQNLYLDVLGMHDFTYVKQFLQHPTALPYLQHVTVSGLSCDSPPSPLQTAICLPLRITRKYLLKSLTLEACELVHAKAMPILKAFCRSMWHCQQVTLRECTWIATPERRRGRNWRDNCALEQVVTC